MEKAKPSRRDIQFYSKKNQTLVIVHSQWAHNYANRLEEDDNVVLYRACEPLIYENFELVSPLDIRKDYWPKADGGGAHWETDFYLEFADGHRTVREIVRSKGITRAVAEQLELSRRYWAAQGIDDWKSILFEKQGKTLGDGEDVTIEGEVFRVVQETCEGGYLVSCEQPDGIRFLAADSLRTALRVEAPHFCNECIQLMKKPTDAIKTRMCLIKPLLEETSCVSDKSLRKGLAREIAGKNQTTARRVLRLYYRYLALGAPMVPKTQEKAQVQTTYLQAIKRFHFSAKKPTLKETYVFMLSAYYTDTNGQLRPGYPSWDSFRMFYYRKRFNKRPQAEIARNGLTNYQRNLRPLHGAQSHWKENIGVFQMDATIADIYLVEEYDRKEVMGRPNVYLAVDTASQLIAGVYVGMEQGEQSVLSCLVNAAMDKVSFCREYGINISPEKWPNMGLPKRILIDRGWEFSGGRMDELCVRFGMEVERLPPFRPDCKGMVEKSFDLLQSQYKSILRGKGVIEPDAQERWAVDYRTQARLTLKELTAVLLQCVVYLNSARVLENLSPDQLQAEPTAVGLWQWCMQNGYSDMLAASEEELRLLGLPRSEGRLTRTGLIFRGLRCLNFDYDDACFAAGKYGGKTVPLAYDEQSISQVFLIYEDEFVSFELAPTHQRYGDMDFAEYEALRKKMARQKSRLKGNELQAKLMLQKNIRKIVKNDRTKEN